MKKDNKFKISKAELEKIIKEEYANMSKDAKRASEIKSRLKTINEELETLPKTLDEVEASGTKKVKSTGWTGDGENDTKFGEKFEKIGSHLKEDEEAEGEIEVGGEEEIEVDISAKGYFEDKFAELGRELDGKLVGEEKEEEGEEVEDMGDMGDMDSEDSDIDSSEEEEEEVIEMPENKVTNKESVSEEKEEINEDLEEPIEGDSPSQDQDARFNDYMEKDNHVNEGTKNHGTTLLSEGFNSQRKSALDGELNRMRNLAKIGK